MTQTTNPDMFDTDVFIVGAGPAGATLALALAELGVSVHAITRYRWLSNTPRAHITNQRAMEVFRALGVEDEIHRYASPWELMGDTTFALSLTGREIARIRTWGSGGPRHGDYRAGSPCDMVDIPQPLLESVLVRNAAARGANFSFNTEYLGHTQDADGVTVQLRDRLRDHTFTLRARFLVGADGARSAVAEDAGLEIVGELGRASTAYVQFTADLTEHMSHRPSILNWIMSPAAGYGEIGMGLLRAIEPWTSWIAGWGYDPAEGEPDFSEEVVVAKIRELVGDPDLDVRIDGTSTWQVNQAYASSYSAGRVFCAGDAVHRHPPSGGLGSNTCVQDSYNLAWKLAYVVQGHAAAELLDSYTAERMPVGRQIVRRANQSRHEYAAFRDALRHDGSSRSLEELLDEPTEQGARTREALREAVTLKHYEFNAHGVELNQRYVSNAVIPDDPGDEVWARDPELYHQATTRPGAKLPHAWLVDDDGMRTSTLDQLDPRRFTLVTGLAGTAWTSAVDAIASPILTSAVFGDPDRADLYHEWAELREVAESGAVLVRPDGYIAWRHIGPAPEQAEAQRVIMSALSDVLGTGAPL